MTTVISGQVLDESGKPVRAARVSFASGPGSLPDIAALTDAKGAFALSAPVPGRYTVAVTGDRFGNATAEVDVLDQRPVKLAIRLRRS
jgi:hypothetical protein